MELRIPKPEPSYLYIDGQYLWGSVDRFRRDVIKNEQFDIEFSRLSSSYTKVFYYDCEPPRREVESSEDNGVRQRIYDQRRKAIQMCDGVHVQLGQIVSEGRKVRQKGVDVQIAVDMMTVAFRGDIKSLTLLSGDGDFAPLINALVQMGLHVTVLADRPTASPALMGAADRRVFIDLARLRTWSDSVSSEHLPSVESASERAPRGGQLLRRGTAAHGAWVEEYEGDGRFILSFDYRKAKVFKPEVGPHGDFGRIYHSNRALVSRVFEDFCGAIAWEK